MQSTVKAAPNAWCPPDYFALVNSGVYRSAYPTERSVGFLHSIGIKTLALLSIEQLPRRVIEALEEPAASTSAAGLSSSSGAQGEPTSGINIIQIATLRSWQLSLHNGNDDFSEQDVQRALDIAVDAQWHPVLFATPTGELGTSVVVGCIRHIQHWALSSIFSECELFAVNPKAPLRRSVTSFLASWTPEQYPISEADILYRNHLWTSQHRSYTAGQQQRRRDFSTQDARTNDPSESALRRGAEDSVSSDGSDSDTQTSEHRGKDIILSSIERARRSGAYPPQRRKTRHSAAQVRAKAVTPTTPQDDAGGQTVMFADWYLKAIAFIPQVACGEQPHGAPLCDDAAPHVLTQGVRNPPSLDPRSTFTKESIVEEDDD